MRRRGQEDRLNRLEAAARGSKAEQAVVEYLISQGCEIVATNLRIGHLEIDIVAREGPVVLIVEVRTRSATAWTSAFGSLSRYKRARVRQAGHSLWDRRYRSDSTVERMRFDAASVSFLEGGGYEVNYARGAF